MLLEQRLSDVRGAGDGRGVALVEALEFGVSQALLVEIAAWMLEAGQPFLGWFLGDRPEATIEEWARRGSSEFALRHVSLLMDADRCVGGIAVLGGADLSRGRLADLQALLKAAPDRNPVLDRVRATRDWFLPVAADDSYVSKIAVVSSHRGRGLGWLLLREAFRRAAERGHRGVRLDVAADNRAAISLYERAGFETLDERYIEELGVAYRAMRLEVPQS